MDTITAEQFDPEESIGEDQQIQSPPPIQSFTTGGHEHYWESRGIQKTGEQLVMCKHCPSGMEIEPFHSIHFY